MCATPVFNRKQYLKALNEKHHWDVIIIGGGATGLGIAVDSASRGYATLLLEQADFAKATSSRSTKLVHGGVRYLAQGNVRLVVEALRERGLLLQNAPHLVRQQAFIIPCYSHIALLKYLAGLKVYDWLAGRFSFGKSRQLSRDETIRQLPGINRRKLVGGVVYYDGQFDDSRLAINLAQTAAEKGGVLLNYLRVTGLLKDGHKITGVRAVDMETSTNFSLKAKVVINATGVFVNDVLQMDVPGRTPMVQPSQGIHLVVDKSFLQSNNAMMIPNTSDGRVLFAVPWHNHVLLGTTDTPLQHSALEPEALEAEISFVLQTCRQYLAKAPARNDVLSVFAGLRPLAAPEKKGLRTKEISRGHKLSVSDSGLITITGGKWTTYRKMAEDTLNKAIAAGRLHPAECKTKSIRIHGYVNRFSQSHLDVYGSDQEKILRLAAGAPSLAQTLVDGFPYTAAEVIWAVQNEMAQTVEDVLARRLRLLFLNARAAATAAPRVAVLMAAELNLDENWQLQQIAAFTTLARRYML